ncbi:MAG: hypothetical protein KAG97_05805 [Victivallales bacterium]|nr:hypothetical protein [Victivallales bacterium]
MKDEIILAAVDFSTESVALAIRNGENTTTSSDRMPPRDSSRLSAWVAERLRENGIAPGDVKSWICGTGPGSFTSLRCVAALTAGFAAASDGRSARGVPSALAIVAEIAARRPEAVRFAVLYDGRRGEALAFPVARDSAGFAPIEKDGIISVSKDDCSALSGFDALAATQKESVALRNALSPDVFGKIEFLNEFPIERLLDFDDPNWNFESLVNPIYLRPPTHAKPVVSRALGEL